MSGSTVAVTVAGRGVLWLLGGGGGLLPQESPVPGTTPEQGMAQPEY